MLIDHFAFLSCCSLLNFVRGPRMLFALYFSVVFTSFIERSLEIGMSQSHRSSAALNKQQQQTQAKATKARTTITKTVESPLSLSSSRLGSSARSLKLRSNFLAEIIPQNDMTSTNSNRIDFFIANLWSANAVTEIKMSQTLHGNCYREILLHY